MRGHFQDPLGAHLSRKCLGRMTGARISREKAWVAWLGRVFLEKKLGSHCWGAFFPRKSLGCMAGARIFAELGDSVTRKRKKWAQQISHNFRLQLLFKSCHFEQLVCGGTFRTPWRRISREKAWVAWLGRVFFEKRLGLYCRGA